jgi:hypothetical protein
MRHRDIRKLRDGDLVHYQHPGENHHGLCILRGRFIRVDRSLGIRVKPLGEKRGQRGCEPCFINPRNLVEKIS